MLHGSFSYVLQDDAGQIFPAHSISAGLDYPGVGPEHSFYKDSTRAEYVPITDAEALDAFVYLSRIEGITPEETQSTKEALDRALASAGPGDLVLVTGSLFVAAEAREAVLGIQPERYPDLLPPDLR